LHTATSTKLDYTHKTQDESHKTYRWWKTLCAIALANMGLWVWMITTSQSQHSTFYIQATLSGIYVLVCAFRSFYPRIDLERYCLHDTPLSSVALGRSLATIAEICFSIQCAIIVYSLSMAIESQLAAFVAYTIVPTIVMAQLFCWHATLTLNHFWHSLEEMAWVVMLILTAACFVAGFIYLSSDYILLMIIGFISCLASIWIMLVIDIPMYLSRTSEKEHHHSHLSIQNRMHDAIMRRVQTNDWAIWKQEVLWLTSYFTVGVWLSIGMIVIEFQ
jgi:hypothetical protein